MNLVVREQKMAQDNPQTTLLGHSQAKVDLYGRYLSIYLNILSRVDFVDRIYLFDLLCGEGIYEDGAKGSPIIALDTIRRHYYANDETCPNITVWFNDNALSQIDPSTYKITRVKRFCDEIEIPVSVDIKFFREDYDILVTKAQEVMNADNRSKGLFFIDPYGYKEIKPRDIRNILDCGNTEVLLFLPISHMYRFAEKSINDPFPGGYPLRNFLTELFGKNLSTFNSVYDFIIRLKNQFRVYLQPQEVFVDTFTIERDSSNVYCLFFFTSHIRGYEKMLGAKWRIDPNRGKGYTKNKTLSFFSEIEISGYDQKLYTYIAESPYRTNKELYEFGLMNGFLPKHTNKILRKWKDGGEIQVFPLDNKTVRGFYINYGSNRTVGFKISD